MAGVAKGRGKREAKGGWRGWRRGTRSRHFRPSPHSLLAPPPPSPLAAPPSPPGPPFSLTGPLQPAHHPSLHAMCSKPRSDMQERRRASTSTMSESGTHDSWIFCHKWARKI
jgi:hypothetical protein